MQTFRIHCETENLRKEEEKGVSTEPSRWKNYLDKMVKKL